MSRPDTSNVICFYANPVTGKVEKHLMSSVNWEEATKGHVIERRRVLSGEEHLWTLDPPKAMKPEELIDLTPIPFDVKIMDSQPPPALQRNTLRERPVARG